MGPRDGAEEVETRDRAEAEMRGEVGLEEGQEVETRDKGEAAVAPEAMVARRASPEARAEEPLPAETQRAEAREGAVAPRIARSPASFAAARNA